MQSDLTIHHVFFIIKKQVEATWPSGKAEACKAFIPSSNLGVAFLILESVIIK